MSPDELREAIANHHGLEGVADLLFLAGSSTRLKALFILGMFGELAVMDLAELLGVTASATGQHLALLKARGLVAGRRDANVVYYQLTEHPFNVILRREFFPHFMKSVG